MTISFFLKILKNEKKMLIICEVQLFELSERELGWRFTARFHTGAVAKPVPVARRLFMTWTPLNKFLGYKIIAV